ncbi:F-box protein [Panicum miliaceum]|uniref:F-box protein n=1 Tax=Panicum miliaceum TaxID=4540 RepID=A0A3L6PP74_PANMI|nr:F-box protein [Panicum miliaceum]
MSLTTPEKQRGNTTTNNDEEIKGAAALPEDQVFELLTRVPLDDLAACRVVSTRWRRITYEPAFAPLHCRRAAAVSGYFVQSMARHRYRADFVSMHASPAAAVSLDFLPSAHVRLEAVAAHRGLACCVEADTRRRPCYYVCKPATRQWRALPNPRVRFRTAATAMVARPSSGGAAAAEFKIARFSVPALRDRLRCEVFDSRRFAWRRAADVPLCPDSLDPSAPAVRAHGAVHWLRWPDQLTGAQDVFAFDLRTEAWRLVPLPREVDERDDPWARKQISAVEGRLCLMVTTEAAAVDEEVLEVWGMAGYAEGRWEKKMAVSLKSLQAQEGNAMILQDLYSSDVAFLDTFCRVMWYDFLRGKMAEVKVNHVCIQQVFKYESDLIPCELGKARHPPLPARAPSSKEAQRGDCNCML